MLYLVSIQNGMFKMGKFRIAPPVLISTFLSIFPHIAGDNYLQWAGLDSIIMLTSWYTMIILGIGTLAYFAIVYQKEWFGFSSKNKFKKYFKIFSFAFLGLAATLIPYYLGMGNYFFSAIDLMTGSQNSQQILYLVAWTFGISFMLTDMFNSLDGKSGIIFKMPPINRSPVKRYSMIDYKFKKFFNL